MLLACNLARAGLLIAEAYNVTSLSLAGRFVSTALVAFKLGRFQASSSTARPEFVFWTPGERDAIRPVASGARSARAQQVRTDVAEALRVVVPGEPTGGECAGRLHQQTARWLRRASWLWNSQCASEIKYSRAQGMDVAVLQVHTCTIIKVPSVHGNARLPKVDSSRQGRERREGSTPCEAQVSVCSVAQ